MEKNTLRLCFPLFKTSVRTCELLGSQLARRADIGQNRQALISDAIGCERLGRNAGHFFELVAKMGVARIVQFRSGRFTGVSLGDQILGHSTAELP